MDNLVFEDSISAEVSQSEFISKKWVYVNDINNGNYTSQIIIDSTPLSNSGAYVNWAEGYIAMPLVVSLVGQTTAPAVVAVGSDANLPNVAHSWAFRSGFWHMINSMSIEFNNQNIVQQTPFLNVFRSFKANTSFSADDLKQGSSIGFFPDSAGSWAYATGADVANGQGLSNNRSSYTVGPITTTGYAPSSVASYNPSNVGVSSDYNFNNGHRTRSEWYGYAPLATNAKGQDLICGADTCVDLFRAFKLPQTTTGDNIACWGVMAKLRLKDLADYFQKCPLLKGSTMRFLINTNQTTVQFTNTYTAGGANLNAGASTISAVSVISQGQTTPITISSGDTSQGLSKLPTGIYQMSVNIFQASVTPYGGASTTLKPFANPVRLYAPVYKMNPIAEQRYLSLAPTKRIEYCDIFQYQFSDIQAGGNFNFLVSNGIPNIQSVLVVPFLGAGAGANELAYNTLQSPFSTTGATPDPLPLTQFNVLVSGVNLFLNNQIYDYEQYLQELNSSNQLNGNLTTGLSSGLISEDDFSRGMRYYYGNASRMLPSEEGVSRSVQIIGRNASKLKISLMVFVEFKKSMTVDISTGARID